MVARLAASAVLSTLLGICACAGIANPVLAPSPSRGLQCRPLYGNERGLLIELKVSQSFAPDSIVALFRDGHQLVAFQVSELGDLPETVILGDPILDAGASHHYQCGVWRDDVRLTLSEMTVIIAQVPQRPLRPDLRLSDSAVRIDWSVPEGVWATVLRRNVLTGSEPEVISPLLSRQSWLDTTVEPGCVYAYSLRAAAVPDQVPFYSERGPEGYIDVP